MAARFTEEPIYVDYAQFGELRTFGSTNEAAMEREPLPGSLCWIDWATIPDTPPAQAPWPGGPQVGSVVGISDVPLAMVPDQPRRYSYRYVPGAVPPYDRFAQMVPASYSNGAYAPVLHDILGAVVVYDPAVWIADSLLMIIEFLYHTPEELGYTPPFTIDYWRYVGDTPENGLSSIGSVGTGTGHVYAGTAGGVASFRTLLADPTDAGSGIQIQDVGNDVVISNTLTGSNKGSAGFNTGQVFDDKVAGLLGFRSIVAGAGVTVSQISDNIIISSSGGGGGLSGLANEGPGVQIYAGTMGSTALLRTLQPGGMGGLTATVTGTPLVDERIVLENTMDGNSLGGTYPIFSGRSGDLLNFFGLTAGTDGITLTPSGTDITISNSLNGLSHPGDVAVFTGKTGATLNFRSLSAGTGGILLTSTADTVTIENSLDGANLPGGVGVYKNKTGATLNFLSLVAAASSGLQLTLGADTISISAAAGSVITQVTSSGGAIALANPVVGNTLSLKGLTALSGGILLAETGGAITIDNSLTGQNTNAAGGIYKTKTADKLIFKNIAAGSGLLVSDGIDTVTVSLVATPISTIANEGGGFEIYDTTTSTATSAFLRTVVAGTGGVLITQEAKTIAINNSLDGQSLGGQPIFVAKVGTKLTFNGLTAGTGGISISSAAGVLTIDNTMDGANVGGGTAQVYKDKNGPTLRFRSFIAGTGISLASPPGADDITISITGGTPVTSITNEGVIAGAITVYDQPASTASNAVFRSLSAGPSGGLTVTQSAGTIFINNTIAVGTLGSGTNLFASRLGDTLRFKTLNAGTNVTLGGDANNIIVNVIGVVNSVGNTGTGAALVDTTSATAVLIRSLVAGPLGGISVAVGTGAATNTVVIDNTLSGTSGTGTAIYTGRSGSVLGFRSISAGANISFAAITSADIQISVTGVVTAVQNEGTGTALVDTPVGSAAQIRTLVAGSGGISVSVGTAAATNTVVIDNTLAGASIGTGTAVYAGKSGSVMSFRSLLPGANVAFSTTTPEITIGVTGVVTSVTSPGTGTSLLDTTAGTPTAIALRSIVVGNGGLSVAQGPGSTLLLDNLAAGVSLGGLPIYLTKSGATMQFYGISAGTGGISITGPTGGAYSINNTFTGQNINTGASNFQIYRNTSSGVMFFRTLIAGSGITLAQDSNDNISISLTSGTPITAIQNEGTGTGEVYDYTSGSTAILRTLAAGPLGGLTIANGTGIDAGNIFIDNTLDVGTAGTGTSLYVSRSGATLNFKTLSAGSNVSFVNTTNDIKVNVVALTAVANEGIGEGPIYDSTASTAALATLRSIKQGSGGIAVSLGSGANTGTVVIDNTLAGTSLGVATSTAIYTGKTGASLNFRSLLPGANIVFTTTTNDITIAANVGVTAVNNEGTGVVLVDTTAPAATPAIRSLVAGTGMTVAVGVGPATNTVLISSTVNVASVATGTTLYGGVTGSTYGIKGLVAGTNVVFATSATDVTISVPNVVVSANNEGTGAAVLDTTAGTATALLLRTLVQGPSGGLTVAVGTGTATNTVVIDNTLTGTSLGVATSAAIYTGRTGASLNFKSLLPGSNIVFTTTTNDITITANVGVTSVANEGTGAQLVDTAAPASAAAPAIRSLVAGTGMTVAVGTGTTTNTVLISSTVNVASVATGTTLYAGVTGATYGIKGLVAGTNVVLSPSTTDLTISVPNVVVSAANEGTGAAVLDTTAGTATALLLRTLLQGPSGGLTVAVGTGTATNTVVIDNTLVGTSLGVATSAAIYTGRAGATLNFRSLLPGANISFTTTTNDITIAATGLVSSVSNEGTGAALVDTTAPASVTAPAVRSLVAGTGMTVAVGTGTTTNTILISSIVNVTGVSTGVTLYAGVTGSTYGIKGLVAGTNVTLTPSATDLTVSVPNVVASAANEGTGAAVLDTTAGTATALLLRTLVQGASGGLTVAVGTGTATNTVIIDNTLTGTSLGVATSTAIYTGRTGASLNFKSLLPGANIVFTTTTNDITIAANVGVTSVTNEGTGAVLVDTTAPASVAAPAVRSLVAGTGMTVAVGTGTTTNTVLISSTVNVTGVSTGATLYAGVTGSTYGIKGLVAGTNVTITPSATDLTVSVPNVVASAANEGTGAAVLDTTAGTATALLLRTLVQGPSGGLTVAVGTGTATNTLVIDNTITGTSLGVATSAAIYTGRTGASLNFKSLLPGANVSFTTTTNDITIAATGFVSSVSNEGTGAALVDTTAPATAPTVRTLVAGTGMTVAVGAGAATNTVLISSTVNVTGVSTGVTLYAGVTGSTYGIKGLVAGTNVTLTPSATDLTINVPNLVASANNEGTGAAVLDTTAGTATALLLRTLVQGPSGGLTVAVGTGTATNTIVIDNTVTGTSLGVATSAAIYTGRTGASLNFKSLLPGANIAFTTTTNDITIAATGLVTSVTNEGTGAALVDTAAPASVTTPAVRSLVAGTGMTVAVGTGTATNTVLVSSTVNVASVATGSAIYAGVTGSTYGIKGLVAGTNVTLTPSATDLTVSVPNVVVTAANEGTGAAILDTTAGTATALLLRTLVQGASGGLTVAVGTGTATNTVIIDNTITGTSLGVATSAAIYTGRTGASLNFKSLLPGANITFTTTTNDITIAASVGVTSVTNEGTGAALVDTAAPASVAAPAVRSLVAGTGMTVAVGTGTATNTVLVSSTVNVASVSTGTAIYAGVTGATYGIKGLVAGTNITLSQTGTDITINSSGGGGGVTSIQNDVSGGGQGVWASTVAGVATLKAILGATTSGLTVTSNASTITVTNSMTGANLGSGPGLIWSDKSAGNLRFRSLSATAGSGLTVTTVGDDIILSPTTGVFTTGYAAVGSGISTYDSMTGNTANFRSISGTPNNGVTVSLSGQTIAVDNTLSGTSLGAGTPIYAGKISAASGQLQFNSLAVDTTSGLTIAGPVAGVITLTNSLTGLSQGSGVSVFMSKNTSGQLLFRSISATLGSGLTVTGSGGDLILSPTTGVFITAIANVGTGTAGSVGVWDSNSGSTAQFRSLVAGTGGASVTLSGQNILIDNTLAGATMTATGTGIANIYAGKTLGANATLNFRAIISAAGSGLDLTQNANDVTISASANSVVTAANIGTGTGVYSGTVGNQAQFKTLVPGTGGISISTAANTTTVVIDNTLVGLNVGTGSTLYVTKAATVPPTLNIKSIVGGSNMFAFNNTNDITLLANLSAWKAADEKTNGTAGGSSTSSTVHVRTIGTLSSLGSDTTNVTQGVGNTTQLILQPGRYFVVGSAPAMGANAHVAYVATPAGTILIRGTAEYTTGTTAMTRSTFRGVINVAVSAVTIQVNHFIQTGLATTGLGRAVSQGTGFTEVYTEITVIMLCPTA